jgi:gas vesicle protein
MEDAKTANASRDIERNNLLEGMNSNLGQLGEDIIVSDTERANATDATINDTAEQVRTRIQESEDKVTTTQQRLEEAQARIADLTSQGFQAMDPPIQEAAEAARIAAEAAEAQASAVRASVRSGHGGKLFSGGRAKGGGIGANEFAMVGEAGPEFISGPANVMSANTSMGVMQTLMKSIKSLDSNVQEVQSNVANEISTSSAAQSQSMNGEKLDTMINLLGQLITVENMAVGTQRKTMKATKGLSGNMLRGL